MLDRPLRPCHARSGNFHTASKATKSYCFVDEVGAIQEGGITESRKKCAAKDFLERVPLSGHARFVGVLALGGTGESQRSYAVSRQIEEPEE